MPRRLAQKIILSLTVIVIIIAGISGFVNLKTQERQLVDAMILGADQLSKGITSATWHAMLANNLSSAYQVMQTIALKQGIDRIRIFNRDGRVMYSTRADDEPLDANRRSEACSGCHGAQRGLKVDAPSRVRITRGPEGRRNLTMVTPIYNEPSCSQAACHAHPASNKVLGVLDVALNLDTIDRELADMKVRVLFVTGIEIMLISVFIILFTRRFVGIPIRQLIEGTKQVSAMNLEKPIDIVHTSEELDELARSFNIMRERLGSALAEINHFTHSLESKVEERTEQLKAAHQKLLQSDRLASLGQLAASVAHEINNPVSGVLNLSMLLQRILKEDGVPPERLPDFKRYLAQVTAETARVGRIVSDLLAFSRRSKPQRSQADVNKIIRTTLSLVSHKLRLNDVEIELDLDGDLPLVPCDSSQIQQVVLNLVLNAAESTYGKGQGKVVVRTMMAPQGGAVVLTITDNGEGISPENISKIFDPFFTTKPEGKGVGLGLAVLYGIVEAHGGDVDVKSKLGQGTTFKVTLPLAPSESPVVVAMGERRN